MWKKAGKTIGKSIGKSVLILLAGIGAATALVWVSYLIPLSEDSVHVAESVRLLDQEGWYPTAPLMRRYEGVPMGRNGGGIMDNFSDSVIITTAGRGAAEGALYQAMNMASAVIPEGYSYYWHGYVAFLRPLLCIFDYADIRVLNQLLQLMLLMCMACMLYRRKGFAYAAVPLTIYGFLMPMTISQTLHYSWVFYIGMTGSLLIIRFRSRLAQGQRIYFLFLILGMLTSFMDLMSYPLFAWGIPMIWWIVMDGEGGGVKEQLKQVVLCGISWVFGYGGLWAGKWLVGEAVTHKPVLLQAWNEVLYRAGKTSEASEYLPSFLETMLHNLKVCINVQIVFLLGLWTVWWCWMVMRKSYRMKGEKTLPLMLVALSPVVWTIVVHDHTYVHNNFTYRIFMMGITALLASMINAWEGGEKPGADHKKKLIIPLFMALAAIAVALGAKDETYVHNGNYAVSNVELREQELFVQEFRPTYGRTGYMNIYLNAEKGASGEIGICISEEDGNVLSEHFVPAVEVEGGKFYEFPAKLRFDQKEAYQITVSGKDLAEGRVFVGTTGEGEQPLTELRSLRIGGEEKATQLTFGVQYRYRANLFKLAFVFQLQLLAYWNLYLLAGAGLQKIRGSGSKFFWGRMRREEAEPAESAETQVF